MALDALSPLDGRYADQLAGLAGYFSEAALHRYRVRVEVEWLLTLSARPEIPAVRPFTPEEQTLLRAIAADFGAGDAARIRAIERLTHHDVKAVEYYLKERLEGTSLADVREFVHFCCTSEDINNLAYALMLREGLTCEWRPLADRLCTEVAALAAQTRDQPLLSHTHGQAASPSTLGKELAVFAYRWRRQLAQLDRAEFLGKFNGAVGSYNAHVAAYPDAPWEQIARAFVEGLGLTFNPLTTQIEPHDYLAEIFHNLIRYNTVAIDFARDLWAYISLGYFRQRAAPEAVGSSTMPHKVNPIHFENAEANLGLSNALLDHLATKLPVSRLQRDLTDYSTLRNIGVALGHATVALRSALQGLAEVAVDPEALARDLDAAWEVLAEAVQTVMRKHGLPNPYEQLKGLTRGAQIDRDALHAFIRALDLPPAEKQRLLSLTPATYIGLAPALVDHLP
jgi:adenylosuccinate lyase